MNFIKVIATKDESSHWYLIPINKIDRFNERTIIIMRLLEADHEAAEDEINKFEKEFGLYRTGGDLNNVQLYIKE